MANKQAVVLVLLALCGCSTAPDYSARLAKVFADGGLADYATARRSDMLQWIVTHETEGNKLLAVCREAGQDRDKHGKNSELWREGTWQFAACEIAAAVN
jgi:hypothetical protein